MHILRHAQSMSRSEKTAVPVPEVVPFENPERRSVPRSKIKLQGRSVPLRSLIFLADLLNPFKHFFFKSIFGEMHQYGPKDS